MIDAIFNWCVQVMYFLGDLFGMTYNEINVLIFVVIGPFIFLIMLGYIIYLRRKCKRLMNTVQ